MSHILYQVDPAVISTFDDGPYMEKMCNDNLLTHLIAGLLASGGYAGELPPEDTEGYQRMPV